MLLWTSRTITLHIDNNILLWSDFFLDSSWDPWLGPGTSGGDKFCSGGTVTLHPAYRDQLEKHVLCQDGPHQRSPGYTWSQCPPTLARYGGGRGAILPSVHRLQGGCSDSPEGEGDEVFPCEGAPSPGQVHHLLGEGVGRLFWDYRVHFQGIFYIQGNSLENNL